MMRKQVVTIRLHTVACSEIHTKALLMYAETYTLVAYGIQTLVCSVVISSRSNRCLDAHSRSVRRYEHIL
jgi:hypothetical protein